MNYVIYGEEQYLVKKQIMAVIRKEIGCSDDMNTTYYNALHVSIDQILEDAQTIPLFAEKKVIVVDHANFLSATNDTDIDLEVLEKYLVSPLDTTILIFSGEFAKMDARKKIVKKISSLCSVLVCNRLDKISLPVYVKKAIDEQEIEIDEDAYTLLCERLPFDIAIIQNEITKLALYNDKITCNIVKQLITRSLEEDVFVLVHAVVEKNIRLCFQIWSDLQILNKDPIYLIALIASQFHLLYQIKVQMLKHTYGQDEIAKILGVHPYRVKLAIPVCQRLSIDDILNVLHDLANLDQNIKSGQIDKKIGFEMFLLGVKGSSI